MVEAQDKEFNKSHKDKINEEHNEIHASSDSKVKDIFKIQKFNE